MINPYKRAVTLATSLICVSVLSNIVRYEKYYRVLLTLVTSHYQCDKNSKSSSFFIICHEPDDKIFFKALGNEAILKGIGKHIPL